MTSGQSDDLLAAALRTLRLEYIGEAPERVRELSAILGRLRLREPGSLEELARAFHRLAGSGGSYGFPEVSEESASAEREIRAMILADRRLERGDYAVIERRILAIAATFEGARRTLPPEPAAG